MNLTSSRFVRRLGFLLLLTLSSAQADNLVQVYHQAVMNDPVFAQAESTWQSQKMNYPIAQAAYLPQASVTGDFTQQYANSRPQFVNINGSTASYGYTLTLTQPILNFPAWAAIKGASATVKSATATYLAAQQSLMKRVTLAYLNVLQAADRLRYTKANKRAVWQQLVTSRQKFNVGLIAVTDVYDARSRYDQVVAAQITAQNDLDIQLENLRAITGMHYHSLMGLHKQIPLFRPKPDNINRWVSVAARQNYDLKAQNYAVLAAMQNIKQQRAAGWPGISFKAQYSDSHTVDVNPSRIPGGTLGQENGSLGVAATWNFLQGGLVRATTKQARYNYVTAAGQLEQVHRQVVNQTRSSFLSVLSGISQVKADKQRIVSAKNALEATEAGLRVGTRTMVDVLNDLTTVYQAQQQYADDQYAYINSYITLKSAAGTLSVRDLAEVNSWFKKRFVFPKESVKVKRHAPLVTGQVHDLTGSKTIVVDTVKTHKEDSHRVNRQYHRPQSLTDHLKEQPSHVSDKQVEHAADVHHSVEEIKANGDMPVDDSTKSMQKSQSLPPPADT